jgi:hypothetical protein
MVRALTAIGLLSVSTSAYLFSDTYMLQRHRPGNCLPFQWFRSIVGRRQWNLDFFKKTAFVKDQSAIGATEVVINKITILRCYLNGFLLSVVTDCRFLFSAKRETNSYAILAAIKAVISA